MNYLAENIKKYYEIYKNFFDQIEKKIRRKINYVTE